MNSTSSRSMSRAGSTEPSGWGLAGSSKARTTCSSASESRSRARCSAGRSSVPTWPSLDAGGAGRSTYVTSAWMIFFGLKIAASFWRRSSGTLTTPTWSSIPPKPPVSAWPRVSVLKTVVLPDPARPTMAICMWGLSPDEDQRLRLPVASEVGRVTGGERRARLAAGPASVPGGRVDYVEQRLAGGVAAEVVAEELDAPVENAPAGPRRVGRDDDVGQVVERR